MSYNARIEQISNDVAPLLLEPVPIFYREEVRWGRFGSAFNLNNDIFCLSEGSSQTIINTTGYKPGLYKVVVGKSSASLMVNWK